MFKRVFSRLFLIAFAAMLATTAAGLDVARARSGNSQPQRFTLYTANLRGTDLPAVVQAKGAISGLGTESQTDKETKTGQVNFATLHFHNGTLRVLAPEHFAWTPNLANCSATANGGGTWKITGGTGIFKSATGGGTFTSRGVLLGARDAHGKCLGQRAQPSVNYVTVTLVGSIHL